MKKVNVTNDVKLVAVKNNKGEKRALDYYFEISGNRKYAFTKSYANNVYELCKSGIRVNELVKTRVRDEKIMKLVSYLKATMPYFTDECELPVAI